MGTDDQADEEPPRDATVTPATTRSHTSVGVPRLGQRSYLSSWMLRSAERFRDRAKAIEDAHPGEWRSPHTEEHMDYVISSVLNAAMFLEAMVNELFTDARDGHGLTNDGYLAPLSDDTVELMAAWWEESGEGFDKTLAKYQLLLAFAGIRKLDRGAEPFQSAALLITLRNLLVHYKPTTMWSDEEHQLERKLKDKFPQNRLLSAAGPWWPNGALGAGCAEWAIRSAERLADEVSNQLRITPNYQRLLRGKRPPE